MNPFLDKVFELDQFDSLELNVEREEFLKDKKFDVVDLVEWFEVTDKKADKRLLIDKLYYVYKTKMITDKIGMSKPHYDWLSVGGFLSLVFYKQLIDSLSDVALAELFGFLPGEVQTDELLINSFKNSKISTKSIKNYHGEKKLKTSTLEWLIDNVLSTIKDWKPEWWTLDLKKRAIAKEPYAVALLPEHLLTMDEIRNLIKNTNSKWASFIWSSIPTAYKEDPEIVARYWLINGGLKGNYVNFQMTWTKEQIEKYFELKAITAIYEKPDWNMVPDKYKDKKLIDLAIVVKADIGQLLLDDKITLSENQIQKLLSSPMTSADRARVAHKFKKQDKLTLEIIKTLQLTYVDIEFLTNAEQQLLMNEMMVDYLISRNDKAFLSKKTNFPLNVTLTSKMVFNYMLFLNHSKLKQRIVRRLTVEDYVRIYLMANSVGPDKKSNVRTYLDELVKDGFCKIEKDTKYLLDTLGDDATYEGYRNASDIFMF